MKLEELKAESGAEFKMQGNSRVVQVPEVYFDDVADIGRRRMNPTFASRFIELVGRHFLIAERPDDFFPIEQNTVVLGVTHLTHQRGYAFVGKIFDNGFEHPAQTIRALYNICKLSYVATRGNRVITSEHIDEFNKVLGFYWELKK